MSLNLKQSALIKWKSLFPPDTWPIIQDYARNQWCIDNHHKWLANHKRLTQITHNWSMGALTGRVEDSKLRSGSLWTELLVKTEDIINRFESAVSIGCNRKIGRAFLPIERLEWWYI